MRLGVTTTPDRFPVWADAFATVGFEAVALPCIEIEDLGRGAAARSAGRRADLVVVTSARTINVVWPGEAMAGLEVASVGPATAAAARAAGARVVHEGRGGADQLADDLTGQLRERCVAYLHAEVADPAISDKLRAAAGAFEAVAVYRTRSIPPRRDPVDAVVFGSPSAVDGWASARRFPALVGAIGPTTEAAAHARGRQIVITPTEPGIDALARALAESADGVSRLVPSVDPSADPLRSWEATT